MLFISKETADSN